VVSLVALAVASKEAPTLEDQAYGILIEYIMASGKSEDYAMCVVIAMKFQKASSHIEDWQSFTNPKELADALMDKYQFAASICEHQIALGVAVTLVAILFLTLCCCFSYFCVRYCCCPSQSAQLSQVRIKNSMGRSEKLELQQSPA